MVSNVSNVKLTLPQYTHYKNEDDTTGCKQQQCFNKCAPIVNAVTLTEQLQVEQSLKVASLRRQNLQIWARRRNTRVKQDTLKEPAMTW